MCEIELATMVVPYLSTEIDNGNRMFKPGRRLSAVVRTSDSRSKNSRNPAGLEVQGSPLIWGSLTSQK